MASVYNHIEKEVLEQLVRGWKDRVLSGNCTHYEDYKFYVGLIGGAERALEVTSGVLAQLQREEGE